MTGRNSPEATVISHIQIIFMCQDLRMKFAEIENEDLEKREKGFFRGVF